MNVEYVYSSLLVLHFTVTVIATVRSHLRCHRAGNHCWVTALQANVSQKVWSTPDISLTIFDVWYLLCSLMDIASPYLIMNEMWSHINILGKLWDWYNAVAACLFQYNWVSRMLFCTCLKILGILEFRTFGKSPNLFNSLALKPETLCKLKEKNVRLQFSAPELQYSIHLYLKAESWSPLPASVKTSNPS